MAFSIKDEKWDQLLRLEEDPTPPKTSRFMSLSIAMHSILAISAALLATPMIETPESVTVEFEMMDTSVPQGQLVPETRGSSPAPVIEEIKPVPVVETKAPKAQAKVQVNAPQAAPVAKVSAPVANEVEPFDTSSFEELAVTAAPPTTLSESDLDSALSEANTSADLEQSFAQEMASDIESFLGESDIAVNEAETKAQNQLKSLAASRAEKRAQELAAIKNVQAQEDARRQQALAEAAERRAAEQAAEERAAAMAAAAVAQQQAEARARAEAARQKQALGNGGGNGTGAGEVSGKGAGNNGANSNSTALGGEPTGRIRSLEQLRQMPGNKKPMYSVDERKRGEAGVVVFQAYVTKEGRLINFKQVRTTGFQNLDSKALNALKKWRFYPGQEGWVELPFVWSLVGESKALGGALRTR